MVESVNVFIPAAGLGERLRPITHHVPKPLLPIAGRTVLEIVLEKLSRYAKRIGINLHYRSDDIETWIRNSAFHASIVLFFENPLLGTGGALKNAERFLSDNIFLVHNADILSDIDIGRLLETHCLSRNVATLAVHDFPDFNTVAVDPDGFLKGVGTSMIYESGDTKQVAFTGIAVYSPEFLKFLPEGVSSVVDGWLLAARAGYRVGTIDVSGSYWSDIGTPSAYAEAIIETLKGEGETIYIHSSVVDCHRAEMDGYVVMENACTIPGGVTLRNCILLPGSHLTPNESYEDCIIGPDFKIPLRRGVTPSSSGDARVFLIGAGGSDRRYYRVMENGGSKVFVRFGLDNEDFELHMLYTSLFRMCGVPVPVLLQADPERKEAFFEDLGDLSLYSWLKCGRPEEQTLEIYRRVLDIAVTIHTDVTEHVSECPHLKERVFDYDHFRWETRYFLDNFVASLRDLSVANAAMIDGDFDRLAMKADSFPKTIIHRDFQSQNIMITKGGIPRLIDYQGARIGPPAYDIASVLWDPYHRLDGAVREQLLEHYLEMMRKRSIAGFDECAFKAALGPCRLQRHMQALGAYAFLSAVKGKRHFLKHVSEGIKLLTEDLNGTAEEYPALYTLVIKLSERVGSSR